jgi:hypothetical protein
MAMFVHLAPEKRSKAILRSGLRLPPARPGRIRGVYAMPVTRNYVVSHQWLRELKRRGDRAFVAVHFRVPDDQVVHVGHYGRAPARVTAAEAVAAVLLAGDAEGYEVLVPRAIRPAEIHAIRDVRQVLGWRYFPGSHGKRPCGCPVCQPRGEIKSRGIRRRFEESP